MMEKIPLTKGKFALVDSADYEELNKRSWHVTSAGYAACRVRGAGIVLMHRMLINPPKGKQIDHIDDNKLNNTRANLRICTNQQNTMCRGPQRGGTSKYKGVHFNNTRDKWVAKIMLDGKSKHLGVFSCEKEAAIAYDERAQELFEEFAYLNFKGKEAARI